MPIFNASDIVKVPFPYTDFARYAKRCAEWVRPGMSEAPLACKEPVITGEGVPEAMT